MMSLAVEVAPEQKIAATPSADARSLSAQPTFAESLLEIQAIAVEAAPAQKITATSRVDATSSSSRPLVAEGLHQIEALPIGVASEEKITTTPSADARNSSCRLAFAEGLHEIQATESSSSDQLRKISQESGNMMAGDSANKDSEFKMKDVPSPTGTKADSAVEPQQAAQGAALKTDGGAVKPARNADVKPESAIAPVDALSRLRAESSQAIHSTDCKRPPVSKRGGAISVEAAKVAESVSVQGQAPGDVAALSTPPSPNATTPPTPPTAANRDLAVERLQGGGKQPTTPASGVLRIVGKAGEGSPLPNEVRNLQAAVPAAPSPAGLAKSDRAVASVAADIVPGTTLASGKLEAEVGVVSRMGSLHGVVEPQGQDRSGLLHSSATVDAAARLNESSAFAREAPLGQYQAGSGDGSGTDGRSGHAVLAASTTSLEVGVANGTHGWLKIRAALEDGVLTASLSASSSAAREMLHRELPSLQMYMQETKVGVGSLVVVEKQAAELLGGSPGDGSLREGRGAQQHSYQSSADRSAGSDDQVWGSAEDRAADHYWKSMGADAGFMPLAAGGNGGWLNVRV
jgi:hypothetical protein